MTGDEDEPGIDGGLSFRQNPDIGTVNTLAVDDVDATVARVVAAGGTVAEPKMAVPGVGWLAYVRDTEGNLFGLMKSDPAAGAGE